MLITKYFYDISTAELFQIFPRDFQSNTGNITQNYHHIPKFFRYFLYGKNDTQRM